MSENELHDDYNYPKNIRIFPVRKDINDQTQVTRGRLEILGGVLLEETADSRKKVSMHEFSKALQVQISTLLF